MFIDWLNAMRVGDKHKLGQVSYKRVWQQATGQRHGPDDFSFDPEEWLFDDAVPHLVVANWKVDRHNERRLRFPFRNGDQIEESEIQTYLAR